VTVTRYEYDDAGRLVRSVSIPEPEWTREDVAMLVVSRHAERSIGPHGLPMSEATDPANQWAFETGRVMDWAEKKRLDDIEAYKKENPDQNMHGLTFNVRKKV